MAALQRTWQGCALYGAEHPAVVQAAQAAAHALDQATRAGGAVLGVTAEQFLLDGEPVAEGAVVEPLASLLHEAGIAAVELPPESASAESAHAFAIALGEADRQRLCGDVLARYLNDHTDGRIALLPLTYAPLKVSRGQRAKHADADDEPGRPDLTDLVSALLAAPDHAADDAPPGLRMAQRFDDEVADEPQAAVGDWRQRLRRLAEQLPALADDEQRVVSRGLCGFVSRLSPGLRQALLRVEGEHAQASLRLLDELAETMPVSQVLDALRNLDQVQGQPSKEALRLCRKLAHVSRGSEGDQDHIIATLRRWQSAPDLPTDTQEELQQSLQEIMHTRSGVDYSPELYNQQLDHLSGKVEPVRGSHTLPERIDRHEASLHAAAVASELAAATPAGELDGPGLFEYLLLTLDSMIVDGRVELLTATISATTAHVDGPDDDPTVQAARRLLHAFVDPQRIARTMDALGAITDSAGALLRAAVQFGQPAELRGLAQLFAAHPDSPLRQAIADAILCCPRRTLQTLIDGMAASRDGALPAMIELVKAMPPDRAAAILTPLAQCGRPSVRSAALAALREIDTVWPDEVALTALRDEEPAIQRLAVDHLAAHPGEHQFDMLGAFLSDRLGGAPPGSDAFDRAVQAMTSHPQLGLPRLAAALRTLCGTLRPSRVARARRLVRCLSSRSGDRHVRRALLRWRLSPASWVAVMLPNDRWPTEAAA